MSTEQVLDHDDAPILLQTANLSARCRLASSWLAENQTSCLAEDRMPAGKRLGSGFGLRVLGSEFRVSSFGLAQNSAT
jgi:hypothetical protein